MSSTPSQQAAIECDDHLILFAGPGSGKTSTCIKKAVRILRDPDRLLILCTFTVEAANELQTRLAKAFHDEGEALPSQRVLICTLDSLALRHLKLFKKVKLLSPSAQAPMLRQMVFEHGLPDLQELSPWLERYQSALDRESVRELLRRDAPDALKLVDLYMDRLKATGSVDLAIVKRTCAIALRDGLIKPFLIGNRQITDFLIDEVQDSDELQLLMAKKMADNGIITTLVGDDDQTIYAWRSACGYKGMQDFAQHTNAKIVRLSENFRSYSEVVGASTRLIAFNNPDRVDKQQRSVKGPGGSIGCRSFEDVSYESKWIAEDIAAHIGDKPIECAVLSRRNRVLDVVEVYLGGKGIPYHRSGPSIWERHEITTYLALLRFTCNGALESLAIVLGQCQFSGSTINALLDKLKTEPNPFADGRVPDLDDSTPTEMQALSRIVKSVCSWKKHLAGKWIQRVIDDSADALYDWTSPSSYKSRKEETAALKRSQRMKTLLGYATAALADMKGTLLVRIRALEQQSRKQPALGDVRLMTMHGSKGLEFDMVYLVDCTEREDDTTLTAAADERRILYVGMTRAKRYLRITFSGKVPAFLMEAGVPLLGKVYEPPPDTLDGLMGSNPT